MRAHSTRSHWGLLLALFSAGLALFAPHPSRAQASSRPVPPTFRRILISGGLDSLRRGIADEVWRHLSTDLRGNTFRRISDRDVIITAMPEHYEADMPFTLADLRDLGKLLHADMIVALDIAHSDGVVEVELSLVAPLRAAPRLLLRTSSRSSSVLGTEIARAIRADSAYRRLRAGKF